MSSGSNLPPGSQGDPRGPQGWQQPGPSANGPGGVPPRPGYSPQGESAGAWGQPGHGTPPPAYSASGPVQGSPPPAYSASGPAMGGAGATPQPAPAPGYVPPEQQQTKKKSKMPLILSLTAVGVVILLVVIGAIVVNSVNRSQYGPDTVAQEYLDALAAQDIAAANEIAAPTVPDGANELLLDPKFAAASEDVITDAQVENTTINGDTATIDAVYTLGGQPHELTLTANKEGRQGLFFDNWVLTGPVLQTIAVELPKIEGATVNGEEFNPEEGGRTEYAVMPGTYAVATPESKYFQAGSDQLTVGFSPTEQPQPASMTIDVQATDAFNTDVQKAVEDALNECAKKKDLEPEGCPFGIGGTDSRTGVDALDDGVDGSVDYTISKQPKVSATMSSDLSAGSFFTSSLGKIEFKMDSKTQGKGAWTGSGDLSVSGSVAIEGDAVSVSFF